jgi:hypothetical protein
MTEDFWFIVTPRRVKMSQKSSAPPSCVPAEKLVRDIPHAMRKHHSAEDKIRSVMEGLNCEKVIENTRKLGSESFIFPVPIATPFPFPKTCSQPWLGLEIPVYSRAFRQKP